MLKVFRVLNEMVAAKVVETYAIGGAIAATFYVEPFATTDVDVFIPVALQGSGLVSLGPVYEHLENLNYHPYGAFVSIEGWDVQFLSIADQLTEEAVAEAVSFEIGEETVRVLKAEHLIAIALQTGRGKDFARVKMFKDLDVVDWSQVKDLIQKYGLEVQWQKYRALM